MANQRNCCDELFKGFEWKDFKEANPPDIKGVYVIKIKKEGKAPKDIIEKINPLVGGLRWGVAEKFIKGRLNRLSKIDQCPFIYIGRVNKKSGETIEGRYKNFSTRHTVALPIWALLYFGWELQFGWKKVDNPEDEEERLKNEYKIRHNDKPALVIR